MTLGPAHADYGNEWLGADASGEHNANTESPLDEDPAPNVAVPGGGEPVPPCVAANGAADKDAFDDGNFVFVPAPPWLVGQGVNVTFDVCSDYFGVADASSVPGTPIGRYSKPAAVGGTVESDSLIYVNAFFDWNSNGVYDLPAEHTVSTFVDPTGAVPGARNALTFAAGGSAAETPPPTQCTSVLAGFTAQAPFAPWMRWRLDYGEDVGQNDPQPLFRTDAIQGTDPGVTSAAPAFLASSIAQFGETESYEDTVSSQPPGIFGLRVGKTGSVLQLTWPGCASAAHSLLYGFRSQLPLSYSGTYGLTGSVCNVASSPFSWSGSPTPTAGNFIWFLIVAHDGGQLEGPWGKNSGGIDRNGPGPGGSSGVCHVMKALANPCGQ